MSVNECHRLVVSLADSLEDLKIQIGDNDGTWTVDILKSILEKDNETKDLIQLAQSLLRLLDIDASESNGVESSLDSWSQLLSTFPLDAPLRSLFQENSEKQSDKSIVTDKSKLEYLHVLATTLQQHRLKQLKKDKETQHTDNPDYPLNLLSGQASAEQKSLLLEGYAYLKEDYEQRRQGMRQRFKVLLEPEGSGRKVLDTVSPHPPRQLNPKEDLSWLVQHFTSPHSTHVGASGLTATRNPSAPKQSGNHLPSTEETAVDRGGRVDDDETRYAMPEWQSAGGQESNSSQPDNKSSNPKKNTGRKEKQGPGTPGRQSNSKGGGNERQQSNKQKDEAKAPEGDTEKAGDKDEHKKSNRRGGGNRRRGRGGGRGRGRQSEQEGPGA